MADVTKTVEILFKGQDDLSKSLDSIQSGFSSLEGRVSDITGIMADLASNVLTTEAALAALAAGGLALAVKEAANFSDSFNEINTLAGLTGESVTKFKDDILEYATQSTASIDQINQAVYNAISMGIDYADALDALSQAEKLSVAGKADLNDTLELLVGTMNAYGASIDEAGRYSDTFFTIVKDGKTTIPELSDAISKVAGIASSAGVDIETLGAAIAALTSAGMPTSEAMTAIKAAISNIIDPSAEARKAAEDLGIQFDATALQTEGFDGILRQVYEATGGNIEAMSQLFGSVEGLNAALVLGADSSGTFAKALEDMKDKTGATDEAFSQMEKNIDLALQNLANNLKVILIETATPLLDEFSGSVSGLTDILQAIGIAVDDDAFAPLITAMEGAIDYINQWLQDVAGALPGALENIDWDPFIESIKNLTGSIGEAFSAIFGDIDLTQSEDLQQFIQTIVNALAGLNTTVGGIIEGWDPFLEGIGKLIQSFAELSPETQESAGEILGLGQALDKIIGPLSSVLSAVSDIGISLGIIATSTAVNTLTNLGATAGTVGNALSSLGSLLTSTIGSASAGQVAGIMGIGFAAGYAAGELLDKYVPTVNKASQAVVDLLDALVDFSGTQDNANRETEEAAYLAEKQREKLGELGEELDKLSAKDLIALRFEIQESGLTIDDINEAFEALPEEKQATIITLIEQGKYQEALDALDAVPETKEVEIEADNLDQLKDDLRGLGITLKEDIPDEKLVAMGIEIDEESIDEAKTEVESLSGPVNIQILADEAGLDIDELKKKLEGIPEEQYIDLLIMMTDYDQDIDSAIAALGKIPDEKVTTPKIDQSHLDEEVDEAKAKLKELEIKEMEVKANIEIANLEEETKRIQAAFESLANIEVAKVQADAEKVVAAFQSITAAIETTGETLDTLFGLWADAGSLSEQWQIEEWIDEQLELQRQELELQRDLVEAQIQYYNARTEALSSGDALVKIEAEGLEPEIEAFMWKILEKIQVRVAEEQAEFLLGLDPGTA